MADTGKSAALEDNLKRIVSECIRLQREAGLQVCCMGNMLTCSAVAPIALAHAP